MSDVDLAAALDRAAARKRAADQLVAGLTPDRARNVADLYTRWPNLGLAAVPLGTAGVTADHPVAESAARRKARKQARTPKVGRETSGGFLSKAWGAFTGVAKPVVRNTMMVADFGREFVEGTVREGIGGVVRGDVRAAAAPFGLAGLALSGRADEAFQATTLASSIGRDTGNGWFVSPDSEAGREQARRARAAGLIDGRAITTGRVAALGAGLEPGTGAYNTLSGLVDMAEGMVGDPLTHGGNAAARAIRNRRVLHRGAAVEREAPVVTMHTGQTEIVEQGGRRVFAAEHAGLVEGTRRTVLPEKAWAWLDSDQAGQVIDALAKANDFNTIRRATGKKLDARLTLALKDATDPAQVKTLLMDSIANGSVRERFVYKAKKPPPRIAGMMPGHKIDLEDLDDAVEQFDRFQRNALMPENLISANNEAFVRAATNGERFDIVAQATSTISTVLQRKGMHRFDANRLTKLWRDAYDDTRKYFVNEVGDNAIIPGVVVDGTGRPVAAPHLSVELLDRYIPLPDAREIKAANRAMGVIRKVETHQGYKITRDVADFITNDVFKVLALALRPAWTVRVVGEEQFRMGAAGLHSAFAHPMSYIAWVIGENPTKINKIRQGDTRFDELRAAGAKVLRDKKGRRFIEEETPTALARLARGGKGGVDAQGVPFTEAAQGELSRFQQSQNRGSAGWRERINILTRHWVTYGKHEEPYAESWLDELTQLASAPEARMAARDLTAAKDEFWAGDLAHLREQMHAAMPDRGLDTREGADAFMDTVAERVRIKTLGRSDLLRAVAHGKIGRHPLTVEASPNKHSLRYLDELAKLGIGPERVKGRIRATQGVKGDVHAALEHYDKAVEILFHALGSVPTNKLSRSPAFRQFYWQRVEELAPMLTRQERVRLARVAQQANLKDVARRLRDLAGSPAPEGRLSIAELDVVAKGHALHETRRLLYSLHERSQFFDAARIVFPFGEAWREVATRWARLGSENPKVPYRALQFLNHGEGTVFHPDPLTGEEMISFPGDRWLSEKFLGVPIDVEMPLTGLNMFGNVLPGFGPVVTIPAGKLIPDHPAVDVLRDLMMPYGEQDLTAGFFESFLPSWMKKVATVTGLREFDGNKRQLASTRRDVMAYLYSTGDYDLTTPEGQDRLIEDAKDKGNAIYLIRGLAQSTLPASPSTKFYAGDEEGRLHTLYLLAQDYRRMADHDFATATERYLDKYGDFAFLATIGKTTGPVAPTDRVNTLARRHPEIARQFPTVFGYFAPGGEVDPGEIERQLKQGTRTEITPKDAIRIANIRVANAIYHQAKAKVGDKPSAEQKAWLRDVKDALAAKYDGYTGLPTNLASNPEAIDDLTRALDDPVLAATDAGRGLALYLEARDQAMRSAQAAGYAGFQQNKASAPLRMWLAQVAQAVTERHPDFADMWDRVFSREVDR